MKRKDEPLDNGHRLGDFKDFDAQLLAAFSKTSAIEVAIYDSQLRFLAVNKAASAVPGIPPEAFVGRTIRDIIGDAAAEPEARLRRALVADEIPAAEITSVLPTRGELGYWILKSVPIRCQGGLVKWSLLLWKSPRRESWKSIFVNSVASCFGERSNISGLHGSCTIPSTNIMQL